METIAIAHAVATLAMFGLIWFVQVVHYPLFSSVDGDFAVYAQLHSSRTSRVVGPLMIVEAVTATALAADDPSWVSVTGVALVAVVWASTAFVQVPCHRRLSQGFDTAAHRHLVRSNWLRTITWSVRAAIAVALLPG